jgi:hypothetical protein
MTAYDLLFFGRTPSGKAVEVKPLRGTGYRPKFLLPEFAVNILDTRYEQVGQVARCKIATIEIPDNLARANGLDPEKDGKKEGAIHEFPAQR